MAIQHLSHVGICVANLEKSRVFYRDGLGFRERSKLDVSGPPVDTLLQVPKTQLEAIYLERDGTRIELLYFSEPGHEGDASARPMNRLGFTHLSLRVSDLDTTLAELERVGGRVLEQTRVSNPSFNAGAVFVCDPDGVRIELVEQPGDPKALPGS
jgi:glyoxylase I family protein